VIGVATVSYAVYLKKKQREEYGNDADPG